MEHLQNGFTLDIPKGLFPLSTDSMVLADFIRLPKNAKVLDLGGGSGTLGVLLCAGHPDCSVLSLEMDGAAHDAACKNIARNRLEGRMVSKWEDLRQAEEGFFSCCVSNPPYFSGGFLSRKYPDARQDITCTVSDLMASASRHLQWGGDFFLVHKPEFLAQLCAEGAKNGLEPKRLRLIRHKAGGDVSLIALMLRKGGKPGLSWEELSLRNTDGSPTADYLRIYHTEET